jgi:hypothetical protein
MRANPVHRNQIQSQPGSIGFQAGFAQPSTWLILFLANPAKFTWFGAFAVHSMTRFIGFNLNHSVQEHSQLLGLSGFLSLLFVLHHVIVNFLLLVISISRCRLIKPSHLNLWVLCDCVIFYYVIFCFIRWIP